MIKAPFILGAHHLSVEEWQGLLKETVEDLEQYILVARRSPRKNIEIAKRVINLNFLTDALPTILKEG